MCVGGGGGGGGIVGPSPRSALGKPMLSAANRS